MSGYKVIEVLEQEGTYDGGYKLTIDPYLLMKIVNHGAAYGDDELADMENPKRLAARVVVATRELDT